MSATGVATVGIKMTYDDGTTQGTLTGLQEVPAMLGKPSKIDVTCLNDTVKKNIFGVKDLGELAFKFLYDNSEATSNFAVLKGYADAKDIVEFTIEFPDIITPGTGHGTQFTFSAFVNVETDAAQVDKALGFTASFALQTAVAVVAPA